MSSSTCNFQHYKRSEKPPHLSGGQIRRRSVPTLAPIILLSAVGALDSIMNEVSSYECWKPASKCTSSSTSSYPYQWKQGRYNLPKGFARASYLTIVPRPYSLYLFCIADMPRLPRLPRSPNIILQKVATQLYAPFSSPKSPSYTKSYLNWWGQNWRHQPLHW